MERPAVLSDDQLASLMYNRALHPCLDGSLRSKLEQRKVAASSQYDPWADEMRRFWRWITYYRHRSELWGLGVAMRVPLLAMFPIGIVLGLWWAVAALPVVLSIVVLSENLGHAGQIVLALLAVPALLVLLSVVATWFFGWYFIAAALMLGRFTSARAKEKALTEWVDAYRARTA